MTKSQRNALFLAWLTSERFHFMITPTPERMLRSPDSLTMAQRQWLKAHIEACQADTADE